MFFIFLVIIILITVFICNIKIEIGFENIKFNTLNDNGKYLNKDYSIWIAIYLGDKIQLIKNIIDTQNMKFKDKIKNFDIESVKNKKIQLKEIGKTIKNFNFKIRKLNLKVEVGTENAFFTSIMVAIISSIIAIIVENRIYQAEKKQYVIKPVYINKNLLNIEIDCIFNIKLIHIIYIIYILNKKGRDKNVRTSNRRSYGYSYE